MRTRNEIDAFDHGLKSRRDFFRYLGISSAVYPFVCNLPSLGFAGEQRRTQAAAGDHVQPQRRGAHTFWPDEEGELHPSRRAWRRWNRSGTAR